MKDVGTIRAGEPALVGDPVGEACRDVEHVDPPTQALATGGECNLPAVRRPRDGAVRMQITGPFALIRSVRRHGPKVVAVQHLRRLAAVADERDRVPVPGRHPVVPVRHARQVAEIRAVRTHRVDLEVAVSIRFECDRLPIGGPGGIDRLIRPHSDDMRAGSVGIDNSDSAVARVEETHAERDTRPVR
jgi:hypothetical protein